jgi:hypothetical protein
VKAISRKTRAHVTEESDNGRVPMNHSNKDGKLFAESEEGRPLIKEGAADKTVNLAGCKSPYCQLPVFGR